MDEWMDGWMNGCCILCAHFYCIPALCACIPTMFKHTVLHIVHSVLLYSGIVCVHFYYIQALFWLHLHHIDVYYTSIALLHF